MKSGEDERSSGRAIVTTALALLPLQVAFRGGEALLPILLASWFGSSPETDSYYLLALYFVFVVSVITGAFQDSAVVPVVVRTKSEAPAELPPLVGAMLGRTLQVATALAFAMGGLALAYACLVPAMPQVARLLVILLSLSVVVVAIRACLVGVLNALGAFRAHPVASGFGMCVSLGFTFSFRARFGICAVPLGTALGELVAIVVLAFITRQTLGVFPWPTRKSPGALLEIQALVRWEVLGSLITRINPVLDQAMVAMAAVVGGGTVLRYANDIASVPTSLLQATLLPVFLTQVAAAARTPSRFRRTVLGTLASVVLLLACLSVILFLLRVPLCTLLFQHGLMTPSAVRAMEEVLPYALLGVAPFGALLVLARAHVALQNSRIMPSMGLLNAGSNALFNVLLVRRLGVAGIALSTSVTYTIVALVFLLRLPRRRAEEAVL